MKKTKKKKKKNQKKVKQKKHEIEKESEKVMKPVQDQDKVNQTNKERQIETLKIILNKKLPRPKKLMNIKLCHLDIIN